jgi:UDPglucose 6-dehydrogenase
MPHLCLEPANQTAAAIPLLHSSGRRHIAIVGTGYVGLVTGTCLAELGHAVVCLDNDEQKIDTLRRGELPFFEPQLLELIAANSSAGRLLFSANIEAGVRDAWVVFIAVGTPMRPDESADLSAVCDVAATIGRALNAAKIVVLKSTVPIETCELVSVIIAENAAEPHPVTVVSNPEFLREGSAVADFMYPDRIVIGTDSLHAEAVMRELYAPLAAPIIVTGVRTSEMIKYAANAFLATKISFMNEIANICELAEIDVKEVGRGIGLDHRIGTEFMRPGIGYGGSCFPKDVLALERIAYDRSYDAGLLRAVSATNRAQIQRTFTRIEGALGGSVTGAHIGVLGLAYKPNTSDVREAPSLYLIDQFLSCGATVAAHDPVAVDGARARFGTAVTYCSREYEAVDGCDVLVLATEWSEYKRLDFGTVRSLMRGDIVFDGRNIFDADEVVAEGLRYMGVGRAKAPAAVGARLGAQQVTYR